MTRAIRQRKDESGFTLIELLVVIIIIGILAAIAIPVFLSQRERGWEAAVQSDLRNAATAQETVLTQGGVYTKNVSDLTDNGFKYSDASNYDNGALIEITATDGDSYCIAAVAASGQTYYYSSPGGLTTTAPASGVGTGLAAACPDGVA